MIRRVMFWAGILFKRLDLFLKVQIHVNRLREVKAGTLTVQEYRRGEDLLEAELVALADKAKRGYISAE